VTEEKDSKKKALGGERGERSLRPLASREGGVAGFSSAGGSQTCVMKKRGGGSPEARPPPRTKAGRRVTADEKQSSQGKASPILEGHNKEKKTSNRKEKVGLPGGLGSRMLHAPKLKKKKKLGKPGPATHRSKHVNRTSWLSLHPKKKEKGGIRGMGKDWAPELKGLGGVNKGRLSVKLKKKKKGKMTEQR